MLGGPSAPKTEQKLTKKLTTACELSQSLPLIFSRWTKGGPNYVAAASLLVQRVLIEVPATFFSRSCVVHKLCQNPVTKLGAKLSGLVDWWTGYRA